MMTFQDFLSQCLLLICVSKLLLCWPSYCPTSAPVNSLASQEGDFGVLQNTVMLQLSESLSYWGVHVSLSLNWVEAMMMMTRTFFTILALVWWKRFPCIVIVRLRCAKTCGHCQSVSVDWIVILCCLCSSWQVDLLSYWFVFWVCLWVWLLPQAVPLTPPLTWQRWMKKLSGTLSSRDMGSLAILTLIQRIGRRTFWGLCMIEW